MQLTFSRQALEMGKKFDIQENDSKFTGTAKFTLGSTLKAATLLLSVSEVFFSKVGSIALMKSPQTSKSLDQGAKEAYITFFKTLHSLNTPFHHNTTLTRIANKKFHLLSTKQKTLLIGSALTVTALVIYTMFGQSVEIPKVVPEQPNQPFRTPSSEQPINSIQKVRNYSTPLSRQPIPGSFYYIAMCIASTIAWDGSSPTKNYAAHSAGKYQPVDRVRNPLSRDEKNIVNMTFWNGWALFALRQDTFNFSSLSVLFAVTFWMKSKIGPKDFGR